MCRADSSEPSSSFRDQGNTEYNKGNFLRAAALYTKGLRLDPSDAVLLRHGRPPLRSPPVRPEGRRQPWRPAAACPRGQLTLGPPAPVCSNRSAALLQLSKTSKALVDAEECVRLRPEWEKGHMRMAAALEEMGRLPEVWATHPGLRLAPAASAAGPAPSFRPCLPPAFVPAQGPPPAQGAPTASAPECRPWSLTRRRCGSAPATRRWPGSCAASASWPASSRPRPSRSSPWRRLDARVRAAPAPVGGRPRLCWPFCCAHAAPWSLRALRRVCARRRCRRRSPGWQLVGAVCFWGLSRRSLSLRVRRSLSLGRIMWHALVTLRT